MGHERVFPESPGDEDCSVGRRRKGKALPAVCQPAVLSWTCDALDQESPDNARVARATGVSERSPQGHSGDCLENMVGMQVFPRLDCYQRWSWNEGLGAKDAAEVPAETSAWKWADMTASLTALRGLGSLRSASGLKGLTCSQGSLVPGLRPRSPGYQG